MADILADYLEWRQQQAGRVSTHSDGCHMWHKDCMIHRLAAALASEMAKRTPSEPYTPGEGTRQPEVIVTRLRQTRADMIGTDDEDHYWDCHEAATEIERLREAIRRLAEQDATLSVCDGNVTVTMDATLTDAEREAIQWAVATLDAEAALGDGEFEARQAATLRGLLERTSDRT